MRSIVKKMAAAAAAILLAVAVIWQPLAVQAAGADSPQTTNTTQPTATTTAPHLNLTNLPISNQHNKSQTFATTTSTTEASFETSTSYLLPGMEAAVSIERIATERPIDWIEQTNSWLAGTSGTAALVHALLASFSLILVSELGDKTFIITAIMAMKNSRSLVFISSASALLIMTILSVCMGVAVTVIPKLYTHYASIVLFVCFGLKMLKEAYDLNTVDCSENGEPVSEFDEVKRSLEKSPSETQKASSSSAQQLEDAAALNPPQEAVGAEVEQKQVSKLLAKLIGTVHVAPIVFEVFTMIFVAEWGDRSQISTVILAAREDVIGVFVGSLSGHVFCTGLAVIGGRFVADMISVRTMTFIGALIFLFFAIFAIVCGPEV